MFRINNMTSWLAILTLIMSPLLIDNSYANRAIVNAFGTGDGSAILNGSISNGKRNGTNGSFSIDDSYNMFYNPSYIVDNGNYVVIEKDNGSHFTSSSMGIVTQSMGQIHAGIALNRTGGPTEVSGQRPIDLIFGMEFGEIKAGLGLYHDSAKTSAGYGRQLDVSIGAQWKGIDPFFHYTVLGVRSDGIKVRNFLLGSRYHLGAAVVYGAFRQTDFDGLIGHRSYGFGIAHNPKVTETLRMHYGISLWRTLISINNRFQIPLELGVEADINSWMILRAGFQYRLIDLIGDVSQNNRVPTRIGMSLALGKVDLDFVAGTSGFLPGTVDGPSISLAGNFFSDVALTYRF